jgi:hypothetical protein
MDRTFKHPWKSKISLKIKVWMWLIWHDAIATKDNLLKNNWQGNAICQFCNGNESISHLFFNCHATKFVWSTVGQEIGAPSKPGSFTQFFWWFSQFMFAGNT